MIIVNWDSNEIYGRIYHLRGEPNTYVAYIRGHRCTTHSRLHAEISAALQFPLYYGENPNALSECLEDLEWLNAAMVYVVIDQAEQFLRFDKDEHYVYSKILMRASDYWNEQTQKFHVILNTQQMGDIVLPNEGNT